MKAILFDFFGTLVEYKPQSYFKNKRKKAFSFLKDISPNLDYELFSNTLRDTLREFENISQTTEREISMEVRLGKALQKIGIA